ncbi:Myotubularin-related protein 9, partial [Aptenodytes forsteri]
MEFSELIKTATVERVLLSCAGLPAVKGTLCITSHHLLLSSCPGGDAQPGAVELWLLIRNVDAVEKRLAGSSGTITLRCKDLKVLQLEIPGMEECLNIASSIEALSSVDSVMMMYPFFYRPQSLKLEEGWHLFPLEQYFQQIASQTSQWRLSDVNRDFTTCPTYPPAVIVPAAVDDDTLRKAARFRQGGRFPVLSYYHPKNGTVSPPPCPAPRPLSRHRQPSGEGGSKPPNLWGSPGARRLSLPTLHHPAGDAPQPPSAPPAPLHPCYSPSGGVPQAGHPFHLRCARSAYSHARLKQEAPLFLLFLDCVWQLSRQFPFSLEFGERLLLTLFDNAYASAYGTFLCNNVKERRVGREESTHSLWAWLNQPGEKKKYLNPLYSHNALVIWPSVEPQSIQLWQGLFFRWIRSSQYLDEAWAEIQQLVEGN